MSDYEKLTRPKSLEPMDAWLDMDSFSVPWQCDAVRYIQRLEKQNADMLAVVAAAKALMQAYDVLPVGPYFDELKALRSALAKLEERGS